MKTKYFMVLVLALCGSGMVNAANTVVSETEVRATEPAASERMAREWGISAEELREYREIMAGKRGLWSPGIDPLTALGVNAKTQSERNQYAQRYVQQEFARTEKELAFQVAVNKAWAKLYPNTPKFRSSAMPASSPRISAQRYAVVVSTASCGSCDQVLRERMAIALREGTPLDVYLADSAENDNRLRQWAKSTGIPAESVKAGRITLNHGGAYSDLGDYPAVFIKRHGEQWSRSQ